jgi:hypothetical protein
MKVLMNYRTFMRRGYLELLSPLYIYRKENDTDEGPDSFFPINRKQADEDHEVFKT